MSAIIWPINPWTLDPSGQPIDLSMPLPDILPEETLISVVVAAVDENDQVLTETPVSPFTALTIYNTSFALVGHVWHATFWISGGTPGMYKIRCKWTLSDGRGSDTCGRLRVAN